ncbi:MAG: hypothetical protein ISR96_03645 [Nitrospira sp.]|nr:hypothetical protein [bacterium]MBL7048609.1 hypothetical protein [Nitrospira sp.]
MTMISSDVIKIGDPARQPIGGWEDYLKDGNSFLKTALGAYEKKRAIFTPEILYNLIAMGIEKFIMAALMQHGALPYNHTMKDLVEAMDETFPSALDELREGLLTMDQYQDICDLDGFRITPPEKEEIPGMLQIAQRLQSLVAA